MRRLPPPPGSPAPPDGDGSGGACLITCSPPCALWRAGRGSHAKTLASFAVPVAAVVVVHLALAPAVPLQVAAVVLVVVDAKSARQPPPTDIRCLPPERRTCTDYVQFRATTGNARGVKIMIL